MRQRQLVPGARHADVEQAPLLLELVFVLLRLAVRQISLFEADHEDRRELETLGGVERRERHGRRCRTQRRRPRRSRAKRRRGSPSRSRLPRSNARTPRPTTGAPGGCPFSPRPPGPSRSRRAPRSRWTPAGGRAGPRANSSALSRGDPRRSRGTARGPFGPARPGPARARPRPPRGTCPTAARPRPAGRASRLRCRGRER